MITLNQLTLPAPSSLSVRVRPQGGIAQYNTLGQLVQDGFFDKRIVTVAWARMPGETLEALSALLADGGFFTLTYPDPLSGSRAMSCRVTDRSASVYRYQNGAPLWADVSLTLEEQ